MTSRSARGLLAEVCVVVFGILIALGVDRLNEQRKDRIMETSYLRALVGDLEADTAALTEVVRNARGHGEAADRVARYLDEGTDQVGDAGALAWDINYAGWTNFFRSTDYTYRDLISTGGLDLIENDQIRRLVIAYYGRIDYFEQFNDAWREAARDRYNPETERLLAPSDWRIIETSFGSDTEDGLDVEAVLRTFRSSNAVRNALATITVSSDQQAGAMESLRAQAAELLALIWASLE